MEIVIAPPVTLLGQFIASVITMSTEMVVDNETSNVISPSSAITKCFLAGPMRKYFDDLKPRSLKNYQWLITQGITELWAHLAPNRSISDLIKCLDGIVLDSCHDKLVVNCMRSAYANAVDKKDKELQLQFLSVFSIQQKMTRKRFELHRIPCNFFFIQYK
jgi:hypothetical protein